jgi:hypothetical protein
MALDERQDDRAGWVSATDTYHWCDNDPLSDWLNTYGMEAGFVADSRRPGYDKRFDYLSFVVSQAWAFRRAVVAWLTARSSLRMITTNPSQAQDPAKAEQTLAAMKEGVPIIAHAVLWNRDDRTRGMVDLLVRSDVLARLFSPPPLPQTGRDTLTGSAYAGEPPEAAAVPAPALGDVPYHYRAIDIKFVTLHLRKDGSAPVEHLPYMVQNWIYNEALGKTQGYTPPASYLVGRDLFRAPARISHADAKLGRHAAEAAAWIRRLRIEGASWQPLRSPSVPELRPNLKASSDSEWHAAKREIAQAQHDLTLLPFVGPERRAQAAASGITRWDDPVLSARTFGLGDSREGRRLDGVLLANRSTGDRAVFPALLTANIGHWQQPARLEVFVSVQGVEDQADDFSRVPERGGTAMFFMITWGFLDRDGQWQTGQLVARDLSPSAEADMVTAWQTELNRLADVHGTRLRDIRLFHWGSQETLLPDLHWFPLLHNLIHEEPVTVRGAFGFALPEMARAFHALGLIESTLPDEPRDPLAAMAGAWSAAKEAKSLQIPLGQTAAIQVIGTFGHAACRSMIEILTLLRKLAQASLAEAA